MTLAERQAELVRALVAGEPPPAGFDPRLVGAARTALLRKRAGEVTRAWPALAAHTTAFLAWAESTPTLGSWRDGWEFARAHRDGLDETARTALAVVECMWVYGRDPRRRKGPVVRFVPGGAVLGLAGRVFVLRR